MAAPADHAGRRGNVVMISVESLSAEFLGAYGIARRASRPTSTAWRAEGLRFANFYRHRHAHRARAGGRCRSARRRCPGQSIVRRPGNEHLATIGEILEHQGFADQLRLRRLRLLRQHERLLRRATTTASSTAPISRRSRSSSRTSGAWPTSRCSRTRSRVIDAQRRAGKPFVRPHHDHVEPPPVHLSGRAHRHPVAGRPRRRGQVHRLRDRPLHRRGAHAGPGSTTRCSSSSPITAPRSPARAGCRWPATASR